MKIITNATEYKHEYMEYATFSSNTSFLGYDIIILNLIDILYEYGSDYPEGTYNGLKCISKNDSFKLVSDIDRRKTEINQALELGKTIVIFTPYELNCYVHTGENKVTGTGRNAKVTHLVSEISLLSFLPINISMTRANGSNIEYTGGSVYARLWDEYSNFLMYEAYFNTNEGQPLFYIKGTKSCVSKQYKVSNGNLVFIPSFSFKSLKTNDEKFKVEDGLYSLLIESILIYYFSEVKTLPEWSKTYFVPCENSAIHSLCETTTRINEMLKEKELQHKYLCEMQNYKMLFTGTGKALENQVALIIKQLGFTLLDTQPNKDDLIVSYQDKIAVIEIKGLEGTAAGKNSMQLEKWVTSYSLEHDIVPKGILIVNTFRNTPLDQRPEVNFPDEMVKLSTSRGHCLVTGLQLLCLYYYCKDHPEQNNDSIMKLFNTVGVFSEFTNWEMFIQNSPQSPD